MNFSLPPHQDNRFKEILYEIPTSQNRISIDKLHRVLGEIYSMDTALTGAWSLFRHTEEALRNVEGGRVTLTRGVQQALAEFHLLTEDISKFPTRLYELMTLHPTMDAYHDASGYTCGRAVLL